jgi:ATP-dependent Lhr-like helicase
LRTALEQLEWAGEVRRGYFVAGWSGEQFGLPEAVSLLYSVTEANTLPLAVTGIDPAALFGLGTETDTRLFGGEYRTSRRLSNAVVWLRNQPVLLLEGFGQKVAALPQATPEECRQAVGALKDLARHWQPWLRGRLRVHTWNGQPVLQSSAAAWLAETGFVRDYEGMVLYLGSE